MKAIFTNAGYLIGIFAALAAAASFAGGLDAMLGIFFLITAAGGTYGGWKLSKLIKPR